MSSIPQCFLDETALPNDSVADIQLQAVFDDAPPVSMKLGMLTSPEIISSLAHYLSQLPSRPLTILDPVMISTSGHTLLPESAISAITKQLLPHVDWVTPNIPEAQRLVDSSGTVNSLADMLDLADQLRSSIPAPIVLLKGGHLSVSKDEVRSLGKKYTTIWEEGDEEEETVEILTLYRNHLSTKQAENLVVDILIENGKDLKLFIGKRLDSTSTHGTGCTLSSAIASIAALSPDSGEPESHVHPASLIGRCCDYHQASNRIRPIRNIHRVRLW